MGEYEKRYKALNSAQKQAVDQIDGPVMVIAGPGTGKTELLGMRTANILLKTDMNPDNILCLTYTESGVRAMRERLIELIGQDAYRVAIQTFHGFGSEVINSNPDYFYSGADFHPADELSTYQILYKIFRELPHNNPLSPKLGDEFSYMKKVQLSISDFKRAGLTPDEIQRLCMHSLGFIEYAEPIIQAFWPSKIDKTIIGKIDNLIKKLKKYESETTDIPGMAILSDICVQHLISASCSASETGKTNTITAWKDQWLEKDTKNTFIFRNKKRFNQLLAASVIYQDYLSAMEAAKLYDYDDMILRVVHALEVSHNIRLNLQEKYQYIMVDEFQDTNGAQMRILGSLINTPTSDAPNIMVVGDDDQAIYNFQGAEISNILDFEKLLGQPKIITLKQNYRSTPEILSSSRQIIKQGIDRLENQIESVDKELIAQKSQTNLQATFKQFDSQATEFLYLAANIKKALGHGQTPNDIAILARGKKDIMALLPYLHHQNIKVSYEHDENILDTESVDILFTLSKLVLDIRSGNIQDIDAAMPSVLAHPAFDLSPRQLWDLSLKSYTSRTSWLDCMLVQKGKLQQIGEWLLEMAKESSNSPVEIMLDFLFGAVAGKSFTSPLKEYYFSAKSLAKDPTDYIVHLEALSTIRTSICEYKPQTHLGLVDFVEYIDLARRANITLKNHYSAEIIEGAVQLMTAHKAKGLEFESVYIVSASDNTWGSRSRGPVSRLGYPENVPIGRAGDKYDDKLRLFFVAMTRAKKHLHISCADQNISGKQTLKADFLTNNNWQIVQKSSSASAVVEAAEHTWQSKVTSSHDRVLSELLATHLKNYRLSTTHLNSFTDVTSGGPRFFLLNNLLHFPQSISPSAAMGSAVHKSLQKAHQHLAVTGAKKPIEDVLGDFEQALTLARLPRIDFEHQLQKGSDALRHYLDSRYDNFSPKQRVEFDFAKQSSTLDGDIRLTGIIDVMEIDDRAKAISIIDYKTGKPALGWKGSGDFEKIKLHKYKQQLMFYRLLIENSREFNGYKMASSRLEFVEPTKAGDSVALNAQYTEEELVHFKQLVKAIWQRIMDCNFADTSDYEQNYKGILRFERDLLS